MADPTAADLHVLVLHDQPGLLEFVNCNQLARIRTAFIDNAGVDIELLVTEKILRHLLQTSRSESIDPNRLAGYPRVIKQGAVFKIMIRMVMSNEDVAQSVKRHTCRQKLPRSAIPAVDQVRNIIDQYERRRITSARFAHTRTALGAEKNNAGSILVTLAVRAQRAKQCIRSGKAPGAREKMSAIR